MIDETDKTLAKLARMIDRERYMNASECAVFLGMVDADGAPKRRSFLEEVKCRPDFPRPLRVGKHMAWKKSEVEEWADNQRECRHPSRAA